MVPQLAQGFLQPESREGTGKEQRWQVGTVGTVGAVRTVGTVKAVGFSWMDRWSPTRPS